MYNIVINFRNKAGLLFYKHILKKIYFRKDPETVHDKMVKVGHNLGRFRLTRFITSLLFNYKNKKLECEILGIKFPNRIGLAAGFDKNAELTQMLPSVGFGFMEVGSITANPCEGNKKPRLWRLKESQSLLVYYGLKNLGADALERKLRKMKFKIPLGINIAMTNCAENVECKIGVEDYVYTYRKFKGLGSYDVINISCPNAYGGQPFTDPEKLKALLEALAKEEKTKPIFLKISPDITDENLKENLKLGDTYNIDGYICTNLTKIREGNDKIKDEFPSLNGGMSGKILQESSDGLIAKVYSHTQGKKVIIGLGGVFTAEDAKRKMELGADLIQMITGMIYRGPWVISEINRELAKD